MPGSALVGVRPPAGHMPESRWEELVGELVRSFPEVDFRPVEPGLDCAAVLAADGDAEAGGGSAPILFLNDRDSMSPVREELEEVLLAAWGAVALTPEQVRQVLPHREPMLFIDSVRALAPGRRVVASFCARPELPCFAGHFPGDPVLPGVYTVEAAAQAADILMMTTGRYSGKVPLFLGIGHTRFCRKILPGDTLELHMALLEERQDRAIAACRGEVYVRGKLAADLEVQLAFR